MPFRSAFAFSILSGPLYRLLAKSLMNNQKKILKIGTEERILNDKTYKFQNESYCCFSLNDVIVGFVSDYLLKLYTYFIYFVFIFIMNIDFYLCL